MTLYSLADIGSGQGGVSGDIILSLRGGPGRGGGQLQGVRGGEDACSPEASALWWL